MRRHMPEGHRNIGDLVNSIPALRRGDLLVRWEKVYGTLPHKMISTKLLVRAVAYAAQAEQHGELSKRTQKELMRLIAVDGLPSVGKLTDGRQSPAVRSRSRRSALPRPGTQLVREWNGKSHIVAVVDKGFVWQGKTYRSLSAIACLITGTRWSGPRFFGIVP
ncbi:DUF2924 domain-containing protein [Aestuariivirga sp.]|uniref:DUF2924 domain-containing protein n=1 Tax=Aestuariivirga sp. TaxID=2650926 RepID=UPI003BAB2C5F